MASLFSSVFGGSSSSGGSGGSPAAGTNSDAALNFNYNPPDPISLPNLPAGPTAAPPTPTYGSAQVQQGAGVLTALDPRILTQKGTMLTDFRAGGALGDTSDATTQKK